MYIPDIFISGQENIHSLYVPVQYFLGMYVLESHRDLDEELPHFRFCDGPTKLRLDEVTEVSAVAVLHYDVKKVALYE